MGGERERERDAAKVVVNGTRTRDTVRPETIMWHAAPGPLRPAGAPPPLPVFNPFKKKSFLNPKVF